MPAPGNRDFVSIALLMLTAVLTAWLGIIGPVFSEMGTLGFYEFIKEWQTLLSGLVAILAAFIAARPVWKQLKAQSFQTSIAMHATLSDRAALISKRATQFTRPLRDAVLNMSRDLHHGFDTGTFSPWAWDQENLIQSEIASLNRQQAENVDGDETTVARQNLINVLQRLGDVLSEINLSVHYSYAEDDGVSPPADALERESAAENLLPARLDDAREAVALFRKAYQQDLAEIRLKIQLINNMMLAHKND